MKRMLLALLVIIMAIPAFAGDTQEVYVYNWTEYLPDEVIASFQAETGIKVIYSTYDSNEAMYARLKILKGGSYDVAFPSGYFVHKMRNEGLLAPIDKAKIPNTKNLDDRLLNKPYDPDNAYSIPYVWGSTGIGYNSDLVKKEDVDSWADLFDPKFKNKLVFNDDIREVFGVGLKVLGYSVNDTDPAHIEAAYDKLKTLMPNIRLFASDSPKQAFLNQEVTAGMIWNGEIFMAAEENPAIGYLYPKEGAMFWVDNMVIPVNAPNKDNAHRFIDYILKPEVAKLICEYVGYAPANKVAIPLYDEALKQNKTVFPDTADIEQGEFQVDVGDAILVYEKYWEKLKTGN
jgi:spermidine/putrescine transport system substrate-binding protein